MTQLNFSDILFPDGEPIKLSDQAITEITDAFYSGMPPDDLVNLINETIKLAEEFGVETDPMNIGRNNNQNCYKQHGN